MQVSLYFHPVHRVVDSVRVLVTVRALVVLAVRLQSEEQVKTAFE